MNPDKGKETVSSGIGRGKLILFGEHAAVYGYPAVGTALPCRTIVSHKKGFSDIHDTDQQILQELLHTASRFMYGEDFPFATEFHQHSDVPRIGGFGSSAALCVAVSRIILNRYSEGYNLEVHQLANQLEKRFHGTPSGIDTGMSGDTSTSAWIKKNKSIPEFHPISLPPWSIAYSALPRIQPTAESVERLKKKAASKDSSVISAIKELGNITNSFIDHAETFTEKKTLKADSFPEIAAGLANKAHSILSSLELSTSAMDLVLKLAQEKGALGGKISGGGMGGAFFICAPDRVCRDQLIRTLPEELARRGISLSLPLSPLDFG